jgi:imidazolonepropionase
MTAVSAAVAGAAPRRVWRGCTLLDSAVPGAPLRNAAQGPRIVWRGSENALPAALRADAELVDLQGLWLTPGLIDCHTHLIFGGNRAAEHELRRSGATYQDIAAQGGGILSTVRATRAASDAELLRAALRRVAALRAEGVTSIEVKSGYGLDLANETRLLRLARRLAIEGDVQVHATFLGAHTLPPEYAGRADDYVDAIAYVWLPQLAAAGLVDSVDVYCETLGFSRAQSARLFDAARLSGLAVRMHAEQFSNLGGTLLACERGALSSDHLEYAGAAEAEALARSGTVAVLLPVAWYHLRESQRPPIAALRAAGARMAVASDCNPGSAPGESLQLAMYLAAREFGLTAAELLASVTCNAAQALAKEPECGSLEPGKRADFAVWDWQQAAELGYWLGSNTCRGTVLGGKPDRRLIGSLAGSAAS